MSVNYARKPDKRDEFNENIQLVISEIKAENLFLEEVFKNKNDIYDKAELRALNKALPASTREQLVNSITDRISKIETIEKFNDKRKKSMLF